MITFIEGMAAGAFSVFGGVICAGAYAFRHPDKLAKVMMGGMRRVGNAKRAAG